MSTVNVIRRTSSPTAQHKSSRWFFFFVGNLSLSLVSPSTFPPSIYYFFVVELLCYSSVFLSLWLSFSLWCLINGVFWCELWNYTSETALFIFLTSCFWLIWNLSCPQIFEKFIWDFLFFIFPKYGQVDQILSTKSWQLPSLPLNFKQKKIIVW